MEIGESSNSGFELRRELCRARYSSSIDDLELQWSVESGVNGSCSVRIDKWFTQEDIAQMIGSSRETVTRLLSTLTRRKIIQITTDCILIRNQVALKAIAES
jgi:CRP-like cAMP-binding protein